MKCQVDEISRHHEQESQKERRNKTSEHMKTGSFNVEKGPLGALGSLGELEEKRIIFRLLLVICCISY